MRIISEEDAIRDHMQNQEVEKEMQGITQDQLDAMKEENRSELFKKVMYPDLHKSMNYQGTDKISPFTKELKVSNIDRKQLTHILEVTDLASAWESYGAGKAARTLLSYRDTLLSAAPSLKGMLLQLFNTEYSFKNISMDSKKKRWLSKED